MRIAEPTCLPLLGVQVPNLLVATNCGRVLKGIHDVPATGRLVRVLAFRYRLVVLVQDVPELGFSANKCVTGRPIVRQLRTNCSVEYALFDQRNRTYRSILARIAGRFDNVQVFDASAVLCDGMVCRGMRGYELMYDDDHLSLAGSRLVGKGLAMMLEAQRAHHGALRAQDRAAANPSL